MAGLAAAALLARDGHRVTTFERFEAARAVGSGLMLQPTGMAVLGALGVAGEALASGARIARLHGIAAGRAVLNVRYSALRRDDGFGLGIHRAALFDILHRAAVRSGATIVNGRSVAALTPGPDKPSLTFREGRSEGPFDLVIDAAGARSPLASGGIHPLNYGALWTSVEWRGGAVDADTLSQRYRQASRMAGLLPIGRGPHDRVDMAALFWSIRGDRLDQWRADGLDAWKGEWRALWPGTDVFLDQIDSADQMTFASYTHRTLPRPVSGRLIHLGDSWHSTSPQLGQGANMALLDACALAVALREVDEVPAALDRAAAMRSRHVRLYQAMSLALTPLYQSDSRVLPWFRDRLVGPLSTLPPVERLQAAMVAGLIGWPLRSLGL